MQRQFCIKLISKITARNVYSTSTGGSLRSETIHSVSKAAKTNPPGPVLVHQYPHYYATCCSNSWRLQAQPHHVLGKRRAGFMFLMRLRAAPFPRQTKRPVNPSSLPNSQQDVSTTTWVALAWLRRRLTPEGVILGLVITNVVVFMLWQVGDEEFMRNNFTVSLDNLRCGRLHTIITSGTSQRNNADLIFNMIALHSFGTNIGLLFGPEFLLRLYLGGAFAGSCFFLIHQGYRAFSSKSKDKSGINHSKISGLASSGALNAVMLLHIFLFPKRKVYLYFVLPVPAFLVGGFFVGRDMLRILQGDGKGSGVAALGGIVVAAALWAGIRMKIRRL